MRRTARLLLHAVVPALARSLAAQGEPEPGAEPMPARGREWAVGAWAGGAPTSYAGHFIGATPGRALALAGIRLGTPVGRLGPLRVEYVAQVIPFALAYATPVAPRTDACGTEASVRVRGRIVRRTVPGFCRQSVYGGGALPLGAQLDAAVGRWLRVFAAGHAGGLLFAENVPDPAARRLNFVFDFGGGVEVGERRRGAAVLGYKLNHISNAWTATSNPGLDHHVLYLGFVRGVGGGRRVSLGAGRGGAAPASGEAGAPR